MSGRRTGAAGIALVGRDRERRRLDEVVATIGDRARRVVLTGEAGIGKTALWRATVDHARAAGVTVMVCRPVADELPAPLLGLADLFDGVDGGSAVLAEPMDRFERGRAVRRALGDLSARGPVLVAIDDVQWLDPLSDQALRYAVRRLDTEPITVLTTIRPGTATEDTARWWSATGDVEVVLVGPLDLEELRALVASVAPQTSRPELIRIHELSGGNPLHAIELARSAGRLGDELDRRAPPSLAETLVDRLRDLRAPVAAAIEVAAATGSVPVSELERISAHLAIADPQATMAEAVERGLLTVDDAHVVRVAHPLLASAIVAAANPVEQRARHRALAGLVTDPDARARHLALSCDAPDEAVADELEAAAARAGRRGAAALAADLAAHSLRVTPPHDHDRRVRRSLIGISHRAAAGETARALAQSDALLAFVGPGSTRVDALTQRVVLECSLADVLLTDAAAEAQGDDRLLGSVLEVHAWTVGTYQGDLARALELGQRALDLACACDDHLLEMMAATTLATTSLQMGAPRPDLMERALAIAATRRGPRLGRWPQVFHARHQLWDGYLTDARIGFESMQATFARSGTEFQRPYRLLDLARLELAAGNLGRAGRLAADGLEAAADGANHQATAWLSYPEGLVAAHLGDRDGAEAAATRMAAWGRDHDEPPRLVMAHHVRGLAALADGDAERAAVELLAAHEGATALGHRHPGAIASLPDAIEAVAATGEVDACAHLVAVLRVQARSLDAPWVDTATRRAAGLLALAAGDPAAAAMLGEAAAAFDVLGYRLDAARTRIAEGRAHRRAGQRQAASACFSSAHDVLAELGATPWARRARIEGAPAPSPGAADALTATERRVADLVAAGRRNREVAGELFVSVATIEAHLTRIYRKLGVRSRTELAAALANERDPRGRVDRA